ncbi:hypothetical protein HaLaN_15728, partial [Haematococcus lacustris]
MTGWLSLLGNVAFTASTELLLAQYLAALVRLHTSGPQ